MNILDGSLAYLIGAIDAAKDQGRGWRNDFIDKCKQNGLKIKFLDPTNKISGLKQEVGEEHKRIVDLKNNAKFDELSLFMHIIVRQDHRSVDLSDFVIFYIDIDVHTCGSYFEFQSALTEKKPYFIIIKGGKKKAPAWLFGIADHNFFFNSIDEVVDQLIDLNSGKTILSDRWVLFRKQLETL